MIDYPLLLAVCLLTALYLVAMVAALDKYQEMLEGMLTLIYVIPRYVICGMALRVNTPSLDTWGKSIPQTIFIRSVQFPIPIIQS